MTITFSATIAALSLRIAFSLVTAFLLALLIAPRVIANLKRRQIGQTIREDGVQEHKKKAGIPTMGGVIILIPAVITTMMWAQWNAFVLAAVLVMVGMAALGAFDDVTKVAKARSLGLTPRQKVFGQITIGCALAAAMTFVPGLNRTTASVEPRMPAPLGARASCPCEDTNGTPVLPSIDANSGNTDSAFGVQDSTIVPSRARVIQVPLYGAFDLGWLYWPFVVVIIVGASNAVNLTDGLDGLAAGVTAVALLPFLCMAYICGHVIFARHLGVLYLPGSGELGIFCASLFGGCLAFLWYNAHPAEVFMGDTGSLAIGGALGAIAVTTRTEVFLALIGGVYVAEALSVIIQVSYFKWTKGQRIFRMSPIHHHFELLGWPEEKVVIRFWIIGLMCALAGLAAFASHLMMAR